MRTRPSPAILVPLLRETPDLSTLLVPEKWQAIQEAASAHRVQALIAFIARGHGSKEQRSWCDQVLIQSWKRHDRNIRELDQCLEVMARANVQVLALKGPLLGHRHFNPPFLRRLSVDVDLGVRDTDLETAVAALSREGYEPTMTVDDARSTSHHLEMARPGSCNVELHTRLSKMSLKVPVDDLFSRAETLQLPTGRVATLPCPADELLGLFIHLGGDRFGSFSHLFELRWIWRRTTPDVREAVLEAARFYGVSATVWLAHIAFKTYWGEGLLDDESAIPRPWLHRQLNEGFLHRLENNVGKSGARSLATRLYGRWLDLHMTETLADALQVATLILRVASREIRAH